MRLRRSSPDSPGITRRRSGTGFSYRDTDGQVVSDAEVRTRIAAIAIPPAWTGVWICPDDRGHVQAMGLDAEGRRQYRYHEAWAARADKRKYARVRELAGCTGLLRARITRDLRSGDPQARALAIAARLVYALGMRVGEERYALERGTIGVLTLGWPHVSMGAQTIRLDFPAKSGVRWEAELEDTDLAAALGSARAQRTGSGARIERVTEWVDDAGDARRSSSRMLGAYLAEASTCSVTPKDLRTLVGSRTAAEHLARTGPVAGIRAQDRVIREAVVAVAERLRNTPAVARSSYIDPRVLELYRRGQTATVGRAGVSDAALAELLA